MEPGGAEARASEGRAHAASSAAAAAARKNRRVIAPNDNHDDPARKAVHGSVIVFRDRVP
jgi:hypothetical protein